MSLEAAGEGVWGGGVGWRLAPVALETAWAAARILPRVLVIRTCRLLPPTESAPHQQQPHASFDSVQLRDDDETQLNGFL